MRASNVVVIRYPPALYHRLLPDTDGDVVSSK